MLPIAPPKSSPTADFEEDYERISSLTVFQPELVAAVKRGDEDACREIIER
jgi:hypothetical protein